MSRSCSRRSTSWNGNRMMFVYRDAERSAWSNLCAACSRCVCVGQNVREVEILRRYHIQRREDYMLFVLGSPFRLSFDSFTDVRWDIWMMQVQSIGGSDQEAGEQSEEAGPEGSVSHQND